ncbi:MAG: hypothetical protein B6D44_04235 [Ignavibacteriales bacterium UTCHB2]|jgi:hypothetical protein|nr:MAG: hypothetical protein B6D44_04235 [Ignavibacteriales bacterium UTCHB2]
MNSILIITLSIIICNQTKYLEDCSDAYNSADAIYYYSRKAYRSDNSEDLDYYVKKALNSAEDCMYYADDCGCDDAYYAADEAYSNLKKVYRSYDWDDALSYVKKAMNNAEDAMNYSDECSQQQEEEYEE